MENTMTKLPEKNLLDGTKLPKTTTGEMKGALGKIRDYLFELFGDDSADKEAARRTLGIDLTKLTDRSELQQFREEFGKEIREEILKRSVPVGSVHYFAILQPPDGYLKADGSVVSRETYSDLFATIGTTFGEGDGQTTFKLPDLIGRYAEGSTTPGTLKEAGMPNITGRTWGFVYQDFVNQQYGALKATVENAATTFPPDAGSTNFKATWIDLDASMSNPIYGNASTVQPAALTLLPCIKF